MEKRWRAFRKQWQLQMFVFMGIAFLAVFSWAPLFGIIIAFKDYKIASGVAGIFFQLQISGAFEEHDCAQRPEAFFHISCGNFICPAHIRDEKNEGEKGIPDSELSASFHFLGSCLHNRLLYVQ